MKDDLAPIETRLSYVAGEQGRLVLCGFDVAALAERASFESLLDLFWGSGPKTRMSAARQEAFSALRREALDLADPMSALLAAVAMLPPTASPERIAAQIAVTACAWSRIHEGLDPIPPSESSHAADFLRMLGRASGPDASRALQMYFASVVDHGMNASTYAARVVASTESDDVCATAAALGALKGRLHGGAPGPVLDMLDAIGSATNARRWIDAALDRHERIMGMGHRVYRVKDPRTEVLARAFALAGGAPDRLELLETVEREAEAALEARYPGRNLRANVELYTAVVLEALGIPRALFTATFAAARVVGWLAHTREQRASGRLIRPRAVYVGPMPPS